MRIYLASGDVHTFGLMKNQLFSFYDIYISKLPFRKKTFKLIIEHENQNRNMRTYIGIDVYEAAMQRIEYIFNNPE